MRRRSSAAAPSKDLDCARPSISSAEVCHPFARAIADSAATLRAATLAESSGDPVGSMKRSLNSVKKIDKADIVVGVASGTPTEEAGPLVVTGIRDPNATHPLRQKEVVSKVGRSLHGISFTSHTSPAVAYRFGYRVDPRFCWRSTEGVLTRYSADLLQHIPRSFRTGIL